MTEEQEVALVDALFAINSVTEELLKNAELSSTLYDKLRKDWEAADKEIGTFIKTLNLPRFRALRKGVT